MTNAALVLSLLLTLASRAVFADQHVVGDGAGWNKATNYAVWAATKTFSVGDTLVFYYGNKDLVYEVSEDDYKNCKIGKPLSVPHSGGGQSVIPLDKPGPRYFVSPTFGHCSGGMKLAVNVKARNTMIGRKAVNIKDLLTPPVIPIPFPFPFPPPPALPAGTCPGGGSDDGGGGQPFNPFGPPNPTGGATSLGGMRIYLMGCYSFFVLLVLVIV